MRFAFLPSLPRTGRQKVLHQVNRIIALGEVTTVWFDSALRVQISVEDIGY